MEKPMESRFPRFLVLTALLGLFLGCRGLVLQAPAGVSWQPGRYVLYSFRTPGFEPEEAAYLLTPFPVRHALSLQAPEFQQLFFEELREAFRSQGLKIEGPDPVRLTGTIHQVQVHGSRLRWLTGRLRATLGVSGTISRGEEVLFAFADELTLSSPVAPGRGAPGEKELLLRRVARQAAHRLLNELLLQRETSGSGEKSPNTRRMSLGLWRRLLCTTMAPR